MVITHDDIPRVLALNKADLDEEWVLTDESVSLAREQFRTFLTSAKTGENVEALFQALAEDMV